MTVHSPSDGETTPVAYLIAGGFILCVGVVIVFVSFPHLPEFVQIGSLWPVWFIVSGGLFYLFSGMCLVLRGLRAPKRVRTVGELLAFVAGFSTAVAIASVMLGAV